MVLYAVRRHCSEFMDLISNCPIIIIIIIIIKTASELSYEVTC